MENNILYKIDILVAHIKKKIDSVGMTVGDMFIILTLEILRAEIKSKGGISELTIKACIEIRSSTSHYYYYHDAPELYKHLQEIFHEIYTLDKKFLSADISGIGYKLINWQEYITTSIKELWEKLPVS